MGPVASVLMDKNPWIPMLIGIGLSYVALLISLFLPETGKTTKTTSSSSEEQSYIDPHPTDSHTQDQTVRPNCSQRGLGQIVNWAKSLRDAAVFLIKGNPHITPLLLTILLTTFGTMAQELLLQFARRKFGWSWSKVSLLYKLLDELLADSFRSY